MKLDKWLEHRQMTRTQFSREIGLSLASVSRLAAGRQAPSLATIKAIERATAGLVTATDFDAARAA